MKEKESVETEPGEIAQDFEEGLLVGLLVGEGHFGGDGRQPQVTLRMHERHEALFRWLERTYPGGRLYGPYEHGGRRYYQWMVRGEYLREYLVPMLRRTLSPTLDRYAHARFVSMCERYARQLGLSAETPPGDIEAQTIGSAMPTGADEPTGAPPGVPRALLPRAAAIFAALRDSDAAQEGNAVS